MTNWWPRVHTGNKGKGKGIWEKIFNEGWGKIDYKNV
jgi:hypothetical protein